MQSMETEAFLAHFGVKGMKWGVRNERKREPSARRKRYDQILNAESRVIEVKARNGHTVTVSEDRNTKAIAFFASLSKKGVENNAKYRTFKFHVEGKHVGEASFAKGGRDGNDPTEINLQWLGIKESQRGKGYGSAVFDAAVEYGRQTGAKKLTLEVPGNSPDARHIYEKRGFKVTHEPTAYQAKHDKMWGGLTDMELDLTQLSHAELSEDDQFELALIQTFLQPNEVQESDIFTEEKGTNVAHALETDDFLAHFGVKGMKWGVRKDPGHEGERVKKKK